MWSIEREKFLFFKIRFFSLKKYKTQGFLPCIFLFGVYAKSIICRFFSFFFVPQKSLLSSRRHIFLDKIDSSPYHSALFLDSSFVHGCVRARTLLACRPGSRGSRATGGHVFRDDARSKHSMKEKDNENEAKNAKRRYGINRRCSIVSPWVVHRMGFSSDISFEKLQTMIGRWRW